MVLFNIENDIKAMYIEAELFPDGALAAHRVFHAKVPYAEERDYYGISWQVHGKIRYLAAAAQLFPDEAKQFELAFLP